MRAITSALFSWLACRFRSRAEMEPEVVALRRQLAVARRQRPGRIGLSRSIACSGFGFTGCGRIA